VQAVHLADDGLRHIERGLRRHARAVVVEALAQRHAPIVRAPPERKPDGQERCRDGHIERDPTERAQTSAARRASHAAEHTDDEPERDDDQQHVEECHRHDVTDGRDDALPDEIPAVRVRLLDPGGVDRDQPEERGERDDEQR
jgi:hypothetical protein